MTDEGLASAVSILLKRGYRFLPHDRVVSLHTIYESIQFIDDFSSVMNRMASRDGTDWFHLVKADWKISPFTVSRVHNMYRGDMDFVDQRSWGPYLDFHVRKLDGRASNAQYEIRLHLYARFWSTELEKDVPAPLVVKEEIRKLSTALASIAVN